MPTVSHKFDIRDTVYVTLKKDDTRQLWSGVIKQIEISVTTDPVNDVRYLVSLLNPFEGCVQNIEYPESSLYLDPTDAVLALKF